MAANFDGETLIITLEPGNATLDWKVLYSDWKRWVASSGVNGRPNLGFAPAFRTSGGDALDSATGLDSGAYYFLRNDLGWRIRPPEEHITIKAVGNGAAQDSTLPILIPTLGGFTAGVFGLQPVTQNIDQIVQLTVAAVFERLITQDQGDAPGTLAYELRRIRQALVGLTTQLNNVGTIFDEDGDTVLDTFAVGANGRTPQ